jgi:hypothetical protein
MAQPHQSRGMVDLVEGLEAAIEVVIMVGEGEGDREAGEGAMDAEEVGEEAEEVGSQVTVLYIRLWFCKKIPNVASRND